MRCSTRWRTRRGAAGGAAPTTATGWRSPPIPYVVDPLFFPGGDIGALAVAGTVNDLAVGGARAAVPVLRLVLEEGLPIDILHRVAASMRADGRSRRRQIVTGDTKVVERGAADKLFINTAGIGVIRAGVAFRPALRARATW